MQWQLDVETAVAEAGPGEWHGHLTSSWNIGENPNGGYVAALLLRAMTAEVAHPDPVAMTTHYLRPGIPDADVVVRTEVVRTGRTTSTVRGTLSQGGSDRITGLATFADLGAASGTDHLTIAAPGLPPPDECRPRETLEQGVELPIVERLEIRVDPDAAEPGEAGVAEITGWIRFADGRPADVAGVALFADAFPPSLFGLLGRVGWVPTLEMTVHVRRRPAPGWVQARFVTTSLESGLLVEDGALWDESGHLVAQARQLAMLLTD